MAASAPKQNKGISLDWFVQGVLTKLGNGLDKLAGRSWKPSSSLATSELVERLKVLIDKEAREGDDKRTYVPHNIKLKTQWDKFSTDSEKAIKTLEVELLTALVDHINDRRYYTYAPLTLQVKPDYFTTGVKLFASFDRSNESDEEASLDVTMPNVTVDLPGQEPLAAAPEAWSLSLQFEVGGRSYSKIIDVKPGERLSVGRTRENDVAVDDPSVSKLHASMCVNAEGQLAVADTGSTNGTFINGERISYGKAVNVLSGQTLRFGSVDVTVGLEKADIPSLSEANPEASVGEGEASYEVDGFEFKSREPSAEVFEGGEVKDGALPAATTLILTPLPGDVKTVAESSTGAGDIGKAREEK